MSRAVEAQPLLVDRPPALQLVIAVVVPAIFGIFCGVMLQTSETIYLVASVLAILGGIGAGFDHNGAGEGAVRGIVGGAIFGTMILVVHAIDGGEPKADLPDPPIVLAVVTTLLGALFGAIGGALRGRIERRNRPAPETVVER
jgi:hypothetical protein